MRRKLWRCGAALAAAVFLLAGCAELAQNLYRPDEGPIGEKHAPVLDAVWAQREIGEGDLWKIYVRASDPDGDLDKVFVGFDQPGALWQPDFLILPKSQRKRMNGAVLFWTYVPHLNETIYAQARVMVQDRAGNMSEFRSLEFELLLSEKKDADKPPAQFKDWVLIGQLDFPLRAIASENGDKS